jgi:hypothetical protein
MKVSELQQFLQCLTQPLNAANAKSVANELERVRAGLEPFKEMSVAEFADFLAKAHRYSQEGIVSAKGKSRAKPQEVDAAKVQAAAQQLQTFYVQALEPGFQEATLDAELKKLEKQLSKEEAIEVARQLSITQELKSKKDALDEIRRKIVGRRPAPEPAEPKLVPHEEAVDSPAGP